MRAVLGKIIVLLILWRAHRTITATNKHIYMPAFILRQGKGNVK